MGLAPYGHRETFENVEVFNLDQGKLKCLMPNKHKNPIQAVVDFGRTQGVDFGPPRQSGADYTQRYCDIAFLIQDRLEKALVNKANHLHKLTGSKNLCIAGGVGLNCVANREILNNTPFERIFIQPAAGDSGQCLGNALYGYHYLLGKPRREVMTHAYFGKEYSNTDVMNALERWSGQVIYERMQNPATQVAALLSEGNVIGWFQFGSELGPRALGHRSILADPRQPAMQDFINAIVKHREPFRPYAPSVLLEHSNEFFDLPCPSPFMLLTARVYPHKRSTIPAVTHVDGTARVQTVTKEDNGIYYDLIQAFYKKTGIPLLLNTSFNLAGEAIVETPNDALNSFMKTQMDYLVIHEYLVRKVKHLDIPLFKIWVEGTPI